MITSRFPLGDVSFTSGYFATLVGEAAKQCYGGFCRVRAVSQEADAKMLNVSRFLSNTKV